MENPERKLRETFDALSQEELVVPGNDPRRPNLQKLEDSEVGKAAQEYTEALDEVRGHDAANDK